MAVVIWSSLRCFPLIPATLFTQLLLNVQVISDHDQIGSWPLIFIYSRDDSSVHVTCPQPSPPGLTGASTPVKSRSRAFSGKNSEYSATKSLSPKTFDYGPCDSLLSTLKIFCGWCFLLFVLWCICFLCPTWTQMIQSAVALCPHERGASAGRVSLFYQALCSSLDYGTEPHPVYITHHSCEGSQNLCVQRFLKTNVFQNPHQKTEVHFGFACNLSTVGLCLHAIVPDEEGRKWSRVMCASWCPCVSFTNSRWMPFMDPLLTSEEQLFCPLPSQHL